MPRIVLAGRLRHRVRSAVSFYSIAAAVSFRRLLGRKLAADWPRDMEIINLFWREQFKRAMRFSSIEQGRAYFDSLQTYTDETFAVSAPRLAPAARPEIGLHPAICIPPSPCSTCTVAVTRFMQP